MAKDLSSKYYVRNSPSVSYEDFTSKFNGLRILKIDNFLSKGEPVNIYCEQWVNDQEEDYMITTLNDQDLPVVIRKNVDLEITFIVGAKYASTNINVMNVHNTFINYMTSSDVWIKSAYVGNKVAHCVCLKEYKPTTVKLQRGDASYIMGTLTMHCIDEP